MHPGRVELADYLVIAERVLDVSAERLLDVVRIPVVESALAAPWMGTVDVESYPEPVEKLAVLCSRLCRNHPLPDGNKRAAYLAMREQAARFDLVWSAPEHGAAEVAAIIERLAADELSEIDFLGWLRQRFR